MSIAVLWDNICHWTMHVGLPAVALYHGICTNPFLNVSASDATGLEKISNVCLVPLQYLLAGNVAEPMIDSSGELVGYHLNQRFDYNDSMMWVKTFGAYCALPSSFFIGTTLKGISYLFSDTRQRYDQIAKSIVSPLVTSNRDLYEEIGIKLVDFNQAETVTPQGYLRRPGDAEKLKAEKVALQEIITLLNQHQIPFWLDCGTCLGAYRYGGVIPWDWDIDLAILEPDFENVAHVLQSLDPKKYSVQDWSSRDKPKTYLKVYVRECDALIDLYHFAIDPDQKILRVIVSNENSVFLGEAWKQRERRYTVPTSFDLVFPLKKIDFDGVEAFVPNQTKNYLELRYGNIEPAKVYSEITGKYEKVSGHPYWADEYVELNVNR